MKDAPIAIFLTGPIGVGKSTLGAMLADALGGVHVEGDPYQLPDRPWYAASLRVARGMLGEGLAALAQQRTAVLCYPLRCHEWLFFSRHLTALGHRAIFIGLTAPAALIGAPARRRIFSGWEQARIAEMIAQGYGRNPFCDLLVDTSGRPADTLAGLLAELRSSGKG